MKIIPLSEGSFTIDGSKQFVPFDDGQHDLQSRPTGSLLVEIQPFIVITSKDVLLLDTGLGFKHAEHEMQLIHNIRKAGVNPDDITKVLMTHLHKDHAGGISRKTSAGSTLSLPGAVYFISKKELDDALEKGYPSYHTQELELLQTATNVVLLDDADGIISDYIEYQHSGGHSPHHQVFWIKEGGEIIFFGGDEAPQYQQMKNKFVAKYDYDGKKAMELRQEWWQKGHAENWEFLFYHDIKKPVYHAGSSQ